MNSSSDAVAPADSPESAGATYACFYRAMFPKLKHFAYTYKGRHLTDADAEDCAAKALATIWQRWHTIPPDKRRAAAFRRTADEWATVTKKSIRERGAMQAYAADMTTGAFLSEKSNSSEEVFEAITTAIKQLPPRWREILELHVAGMDTKDIAAHIDKTKFTVSSELSRAKKELRKKIRGSHGHAIRFTRATRSTAEGSATP